MNGVRRAPYSLLLCLVAVAALVWLLVPSQVPPLVNAPPASKDAAPVSPTRVQRPATGLATSVHEGNREDAPGALSPGERDREGSTRREAAPERSTVAPGVQPKQGTAVPAPDAADPATTRIRVRGTVLGPGRRPVAHAAILRAHAFGRADRVALCMTDASGAFEVVIRDAEPMDGRIFFARKAGFGSVAGPRIDWRTAIQDGGIDGLVLHLDHPCALRGVLLDGTGPVPNHRIELHGRIKRMAATHSTLSNAQGQFEFKELPSEACRLYASRRTARGDREVADSGLIGLKPGQILEGIRLQLKRQAERGPVSGIVLRADDGTPISNLRVTLISATHADDKMAAHTNAQGGFRFPAVHEGRARFEALHVDGWRGTLATDMGVPATDLVLRCNPPRALRIQGIVQDEHGELVPRCQFRLRTQAGRNELRDVLGGEFAFSFETTLPVRIAIHLPEDREGNPLNLRPARRTLESLDQPVVINMVKGHVIEGQVLDEHGLGASGLVIASGLRTTRTAEDGRWQLVGLERAANTAQIHAPSGCMRPPPVLVTAGASPTVTRLVRGATIRGRVVAPGETIVDRGIVTARWKFPGQGRSGSSRGNLLRGGHFEIRDLPPETVVSLRVLASEPASALNRIVPHVVEGVRTGSQDVTVSVELGLEISGVVIDEKGLPLRSGIASLRRADGRGAGAAIREGGRFAMGNALPGPGILRIAVPGYVTKDIPVTPPSRDLHIQLEPKRAR